MQNTSTNQEILFLSVCRRGALRFWWVHWVCPGLARPAVGRESERYASYCIMITSVNIFYYRVRLYSHGLLSYAPVHFCQAAGPRTVFLETRYCLALLFGQLFQYRLREAQVLCDTMAKQLLTLEDTVGKVRRNSKMVKKHVCVFQIYLWKCEPLLY